MSLDNHDGLRIETYVIDIGHYQIFNGDCSVSTAERRSSAFIFCHVGGGLNTPSRESAEARVSVSCRARPRAVATHSCESRSNS